MYLCQITTYLELQVLIRGKEEVKKRRGEANKRNWTDERKDWMEGITGHN